MNVTKKQIVRDIRSLGVSKGDHLNVKVSLKAIGFIEGGPNTVIDALIEVVGEEGTFFTDAFVSSFPLPLNDEHKALVARQDTPSYAGALANAMVKHPRSYRSPHPIQKFAGIGALAEELTQEHNAESPAYGLLARLAEIGGKNLKIGDDVKVPGVGTTHVAIEQLGLKRKRRREGLMYESEDGKVEFFELIWAGGCSHAWLKFYPEYEKIGAVLGQGQVGEAPAKLTDMKKTLEWELETIPKDPKALLCERSYCRVCSIEWSFASRGYLRWKAAYLLHRWRTKLKIRF